MDQWYNCPGCQRLVRWGQPQCSACGKILDWPKPAEPLVTSTPMLPAKPQTKTSAWVIALIVIVVLVFVAQVASIPTTQKTATITKPVVDTSPEIQKDRLKLINELTNAGVFYKVDKPGTYAHVWVTPLFNALAFDKKQTFISVVFAYYVSENPKSELVLLFDSQTGKQVGKYALIYGGLEME